MLHIYVNNKTIPLTFVFNFSSSSFQFYRHIPKAKATTIAETPELRRITENTKLQSNVNYHADFEKAKGKLTQVRDFQSEIVNDNLFWNIFRLPMIPRPSESSRTRKTFQTSRIMATFRRKLQWNDNASLPKLSTIEVRILLLLRFFL